MKRELRRHGLIVISCALAGLTFVGQAVQARVSQTESPFENVQVLTGTSPEQMELIMQAASASLGVECEYCHEPSALQLDDKPAKRTARSMMEMIVTLSMNDFATLDVPSCWTCHRGSATPESEAASAQNAGGLAGGDVVPYSSTAFSRDPRPSREVYSNVQVYGDLPANELGQVMNAYTRWLGVGCEHCHVPGDWASDEKLMKLVGRRMFEIEEGIERDFFDSREVLTCWTCHRGETTPQMSLPPDRIPTPEARLSASFLSRHLN